MNFKEWSKRYYPNEDEEILNKMSHAWAAAHVSAASSEISGTLEEPFNKKLNPKQAKNVDPCKECIGFEFDNCGGWCDHYPPEG